jgi:hypothetical protein
LSYRSRSPTRTTENSSSSSSRWRNQEPRRTRIRCWNCESSSFDSTVCITLILPRLRQQSDTPATSSRKCTAVLESEEREVLASTPEETEPQDKKKTSKRKKDEDAEESKDVKTVGEETESKTKRRRSTRNV